MNILSETLKQEMEHTFMMLKTAISRLNGDFWKINENDWTYAYTLFHALESIEFYASNSSSDWKPLSDVSQNSRIKETESLNVKDKEFFEQYLSQVEEKVFHIINNYDDTQLLENDGFAPRGFKSRYHKYSYTMRHTMYHLGELTKHLRSINHERIRW